MSSLVLGIVFVAIFLDDRGLSDVEATILVIAGILCLLNWVAVYHLVSSHDPARNFRSDRAPGS